MSCRFPKARYRNFLRDEPGNTKEIRNEKLKMKNEKGKYNQFKTIIFI